MTVRWCFEQALDVVIGRVGGYEWLSPRADDEYAECRDAAFLSRIGATHLNDALAAFWPRRGPQWDALGRRDGEVLLIEAKAHISELPSPPSAASAASLAHIDAALSATAEALGAQPLAPWSKAFYQLANWLATLQVLISRVLRPGWCWWALSATQTWAGRAALPNGTSPIGGPCM